MSWLRRGGRWAVLMFLLAAGMGYAYAPEGKAETVVIPLDQIWALDMPGTRDVHQMKPVGSDKRFPVARLTKLLDSWFSRIRWTLARKPPEAEAEAGFAIGPTSLRSLAFIAQILMKGGDEPPRYQSSARETTAVFFSHPSAYRVQLDHVERRGNAIDICCRFVPHFSSESTFHYALIPLGKLLAGEYRVQIKQLPMEQKYLDAGFKPVSPVELRRIVCQSFSFIVKDPPAPEPVSEPVPDKDAVLIPLNKIWANLTPGTQGIRDLEPDRFEQAVLGLERIDPHPSLLSHQISQAIYRRSEKKQPIGSGFAVAETGCEALVAIKEAMEQDRIPPQTFPVGTEVSLFFFTRDFEEGFGLKEVRHSNETVTIRYRFGTGFQGPNGTRIFLPSSARYFALIPLGKPKAGSITVKMIEQPSKKDEEYARPFYKQLTEAKICKSFVFTIKPSSNKASVNQ